MFMMMITIIINHQSSYNFFSLFYSRYTDGSTILQKTHHRSLYVSSYKHYGLPWRKVVAGDHHDLHDGGLYDGDLHDGELYNGQ